jgi:hypothetical protein
MPIGNKLLADFEKQSKRITCSKKLPVSNCDEICKNPTEQQQDDSWVGFEVFCFVLGAQGLGPMISVAGLEDDDQL